MVDVRVNLLHVAVLLATVVTTVTISSILTQVHAPIGGSHVAPRKAADLPEYLAEYDSMLSKFSAGLARGKTNEVHSARSVDTLPESVRRARSNVSTIFVSLSAFRDPLCISTVLDLFVKATNRKRIFIGVFDQKNETEQPCITPDLFTCSDDFCPSDNIRVRHMSNKKAKGPTFGRYVTLLMYRGEEYFLQIDSHMLFVFDYDYRMIEMHNRALKESSRNKAVLSHYPHPVHAGKTDVRLARTHYPHLMWMCNAHFTGAGLLRMDGQWVHKVTKPLLQPFTAAGFLFSSADLVLQVPHDPYLDYIFDGEEWTYSVRMWTHGFDMFAPDEVVIFHYYERQKSLGHVSMWDDWKEWWIPQRKGEDRIRYMLKLTHANTTKLLVPPELATNHTLAEIDKYGLGTERSLEDYMKFAGIDIVNRTTYKNKFCRENANKGWG